MSGINQKEYLKKYLGLGKGSTEKKKKKKSKKLISNGLKIVDDDIDINLNAEIKEDLLADNEDAPQIVSVIDDRPPSLRIDEVTHNTLWKPIGASESGETTAISNKIIKFENKKLSKNIKSKKLVTSFSIIQKCDESGDISLPRSSKARQCDSSPPRMKRKENVNSSPTKKHGHRANEDISPQRRKKELHRCDSPPSIGIKKEGSPDLSPLRISRRRSVVDTSSRSNTNVDSSPPRRTEPRDSDSSPLRRHNLGKLLDSSPPRKNESKEISSVQSVKRDKSQDTSPPRRQRKRSEDNSPLRRTYKESSPPKRQIREVDDNSPPRRQTESSKSEKRSRWGYWEEEKKMKKTLDGKKAGLQSAKDLVSETQDLKKREDELFKNMSAEISGANAATIVRDKKKEVDWDEEERKQKKEQENKEKYDRWGRGLKQVEDHNAKIKNELHEMAKPLARYADDQDLEQYLREQEREGDPMLSYIRGKKKKKAVDDGQTVVEQYMGDAPPNRFGIRPGYRWDGVDRSNGYEKQWFQIQNSRKASLEESYKWSTEDM